MSSVAALDNRFGVGGNNPPDTLGIAHDVMADISMWMAEHPVIEREDDAREAKKLIDRARNSASEIEDARDALVRPLNDKIADINARFKTVHNTDAKHPGTLDKVLFELKSRLATFIEAEEARRLIEAEQKRLAADEAERIARIAESREQEAIANARAGELGVDVTQVVVEADGRFTEFKKTDREATRAERETHVRIGGGWNKAASLRSVEILSVDDPLAALTALGATDKIKDAILSAARDYRKTNGVLPAGVSARTQRKL